MKTCPNCGGAAPENFCPRCGQDQREAIISVRRWLAEIVEDIFSIDGKMPRTLLALVARPGELTREWLVGRRVRYIRPFRLYLITALAFFLIWPVVEPAGGVTGQALTGFMLGLMDGQGDVEFQDSVEFVVASLPSVMIVLMVPLFALLLQISFGNHSGYYVEHLVFAFHFHAFFFLVLVLFTPLDLVWELWDDWGLLALYLWAAVYFFLAIRRVHRERVWKASVKTVGILLGYGLIFIIVLGTSAALVEAWLNPS